MFMEMGDFLLPAIMQSPVCCTQSIYFLKKGFAGSSVFNVPYHAEIIKKASHEVANILH